MSRIDAAFSRLSEALDGLEAAMDARPSFDTDDSEQLQSEIDVLRARAKEDARLRAEAAGAVREALRDLRGAMTRSTEQGSQANA